MVETRAHYQETTPEPYEGTAKKLQREEVTEEEERQKHVPTTPTAAAGAGPAVPTKREGAKMTAPRWTMPTDAQKYTFLALIHFSLIIPLIFSWEKTSKAAFGKAAEPPEDQHANLLQLYASGLTASTAMCLALSELATTNMLRSFTADTIKMGLIGHGLAWILLFLNYPATMTPAASMVEAFAATATALLPASTLLFSPDDRSRLWENFHDLPTQFRTFFPVRQGRYRWLATMYSILATSMPLVGLFYFIAPRLTLYHTFGYDYGKSAQLIWKAIAAGSLMTTMPALLSALKHKAEINKMAATPARTLNMGLMGNSVGHLLVLGPLIAQGQAGALVPIFLVGIWSVTLMVSMLGLAAPEVREFVREVSAEAKRQ